MAVPRVPLSIIVLKSPDGYVVQRRKKDPRIGGAGLLGFFGGKIEENETAKQAAVRELNEETSLSLNEDQFEHIGSLVADSEQYNRKIVVDTDVFRVNIPSSEVQDNDGDGVEVVTRSRVIENQSEFTPATQAVFKEIIKE